MPCKIWDALRALLEPFVVPAHIDSMHLCFSSARRGRNGDAPLRDDGATLPPLDASPHPTALLEVLSARVDSVQCRRLCLAPVGYKTPFHRMHDKSRLRWSRATDDGSICARCNVVASYIAVSVHPPGYGKCGIAVELLDVLCLAIEGSCRY